VSGGRRRGAYQAAQGENTIIALLAKRAAASGGATHCASSAASRQVRAAASLHLGFVSFRRAGFAHCVLPGAARQSSCALRRLAWIAHMRSLRISSNRHRGQRTAACVSLGIVNVIQPHGYLPVPHKHLRITLRAARVFCAAPRHARGRTRRASCCGAACPHRLRTSHITHCCAALLALPRTLPARLSARVELCGWRSQDAATRVLHNGFAVCIIFARLAAAFLCLYAAALRAALSSHRTGGR